MGNIPNWTDDEWSEAVERLTLHAHRKFARLHWRLSFAQGGTAPGGVTPQDLVAESIEDAIAGTRNWNPAAEPEFYNFLRSVVDSKVNHLAESLENQMSRRIRAPVDADKPPPEYEIADRTPDQLTVLINKASLEKFRTAVLSAIQGDSLVEGLFSCLEAEVTSPQEIAVLLDAKVKDINNAQKRLRRKVEQIMKDEKDKR